MHWAWMSERYLISTTCLTGARVRARVRVGAAVRMRAEG